MHERADSVTALFAAARPVPVPLRTRTAVWTGVYATQVVANVRFTALLGLVLLVAPTYLGTLLEFLRKWGFGGKEGGLDLSVEWSGVGRAVAAGARSYVHLLPAPSVLLVLELLLMSMISAILLATFEVQAYLAPRHRTDPSRLNRIPTLCALLVVCCATLRQTAPHHKPIHLRNIDRLIDLLGRELGRLARGPGFERRSPRRKALRNHTELVTAALYKTGTQLDSSPLSASDDLADMAYRICDAYVERRWGALLQDSELTGLDPVRNRETLKMATAGLITLCVSYGAALLNVPGAVLPLVFGLTGVVSFNLVLGRSPRSLELLDAVRGIQRP